eukprot:CAMPEP_0183464244 /NCGR_PEP_ID=MMETSP0370-20130417/145031_1 /TAXON_ID=268820 /ORGANISM="Peridinium aciculiferum, Strain PAER-2" /LENGTH=38 /DNA_ID= /DNA_START= /DNA_END= /DNA_ORIENTATION=
MLCIVPSPLMPAGDAPFDASVLIANAPIEEPPANNLIV